MFNMSLFHSFILQKSIAIDLDESFSRILTTSLKNSVIFHLNKRESPFHKDVLLQVSSTSIEKKIIYN